MTALSDCSNSSERNILIAIFLVALALRVFAVLNFPLALAPLSADAADYHNLAVNILAGKGLADPATHLATATRMPLYPLFLALIYLISGIGNFLAVRLVQCVLGALLCVLVYYLGKVSFIKKIGLLAAIVTVFYPPLVSYSFYGGPSFLLSENIFMPVFYLCMLFIIRYYFGQSRAVFSVICGVFLGILVLIRPILALYPVFLLFVDFKTDFFISLKRFALVIAGFLFIISPWVIRNYLVFNAFVPFSTEGGYAMLCGNNPQVRGGGLVRTDTLFSAYEEERINAMPEIQRDAHYRKLAKNFIWENYRQVPKLFLRKLAAFWDPFDTNYLNGIALRRYNPWYSTILMFALFGMITAIRKGWGVNILLPLSVFAYFSFIAMIVAGDPRFRYVTEPYLIILASAGAAALYGYFPRKSISFTVMGVIAGINVLFYIYSDLLLGLIKRLV